MTDAQRTIRKLRKPPAVHNWVRNLRRRRDDMALSLFNTAMNAPRHSLKAITDIIKAVVVDGNDDEQAYKSASHIANARTRTYAFQILAAILPYIRNNQWSGVQIFKDMVEYYPVAANVRVPVRPTFVLNVDGRAIPYFVICWTTLNFTGYQKRILSTLIHDVILTLDEFSGSDAMIIGVPRHSFSKTERYVVEWKASDCSLLEAWEKSSLFEKYGQALGDAEQMIIDAVG